MEVIRRLCECGYLECGRESEYLEVLKEVKLPWCGVVEWRCVRIEKNGDCTRSVSVKRSVEKSVKCVVRKRKSMEM